MSRQETNWFLSHHKKMLSCWFLPRCRHFLLYLFPLNFVQFCPLLFHFPFTLMLVYCSDVLLKKSCFSYGADVLNQTRASRNCILTYFLTYLLTYLPLLTLTYTYHYFLTSFLTYLLTYLPLLTLSSLLTLTSLLTYLPLLTLTYTYLLNSLLIYLPLLSYPYLPLLTYPYFLTYLT